MCVNTVLYNLIKTLKVTHKIVYKILMIIEWILYRFLS